MLLKEKVLHALCYIAWKCKNDPELTKLIVLKIIYLADRWHLRQHGRTVTEDKYYAMEFGPVPTNTRDIIEGCFKGIPKAEEYLTIEKQPGHEHGALLAKKKPNLDWLSQTDIEALDAAINTYKKYGPKKIVKFVHSFPEWTNKKAQLDEAKLRNRKSVEMDMNDFFLDCPDRSKEYCDADEERVQTSRECFNECEW